MQGSQQYKFSCSLLALVKDTNSFTAILSQHINDPISFAATLCKESNGFIINDSTNEIPTKQSRKRSRG